MRRRSIFLLLSGLLGCSGGEGGGGKEGIDYESVEISSQALSGVIGGKPWTFGYGTSKPLFSSDFTSLSEGKRAFHCNPFPVGQKGVRKVLFGFQNTEIGDQIYEAFSESGEGNGDSITLLDADGNNQISSGKVTVDEVSDKLITARIIAKFDDDNAVEGKFKVSVCSAKYVPEDDFTGNPVDDPRWRGTWEAPQIIGATRSGWTWTFSSTEPSKFSMTLKTDTGDVIEDADETWSFDLDHDPRLILREVTLVRKSVNGLKTVGDKEYCIFEAGVEATPTTMTAQCGSAEFPSSIPEPPDETWTKKSD
jgi:hypothetical protein